MNEGIQVSQSCNVVLYLMHENIMFNKPMLCPGVVFVHVQDIVLPMFVVDNSLWTDEELVLNCDRSMNVCR